MKNLKSIAFAVFAGAVITSCASNNNKTSESEQQVNLKDVVSDKFLMGVALNQYQTKGGDTKDQKLIRNHFNSVVAENCMKCEVIHPEEDRYDFTLADEFVEYAEKNNMHVVGHCLIWHSQLAPWFCIDDNGNNVSAEVLRERIKDHVTTIVSRYKGRVHGWDVVNEAIEGDGEWRKSKFYEILGDEYIELAFRCAQEADPDAQLYYNDFGMNEHGRRNTTVKMVNDLKAKGVKVDAIGMQGHMGLDYPEINDFEQSILAFAGTGCEVMITEWDMTALPTLNRGANISETVEFEKLLNPYPEALPDSINSLWNKRMGEFFNLFVKHSDVISRVTAWGVSDGDSWKNNWPMKGRREYPLLFDRDHEPKEFVLNVLNPTN